MIRGTCLVMSISLCVMVSAETALGASPDQCLVCHEMIGDKASTLFKKDTHALHGVSCADCHGGDRNADDPDASMSRKAGFIGVPFGDAISDACGRCHSDSVRMSRFGSKLPIHQLEILKSSAHGKMAVNGKNSILQCTTCHGAHGIVTTKNPSSPVHPLRVVETCSQCHANAAYMRLYNPSLPVDQLDKYKTSVHGIRHAKKDAKAAVCSSCHGSHDILPASSSKSKVFAANLVTTCGHCHSDSLYMKPYGIPTNQVAEFTASVHGVALLKKRDLSAPACNDCHGNHGATPPGVESISKVCGSCHALNADLFSSSPHKKAFDEHRYPECETCHGKHNIMAATVSMIGVDSTAVCSQCHTEGKNPKGYRVAKTMRQLLDSLETGQQLALRTVEEAEQKGMEIGEAKFKLRDAHQARLESRTMIHSFNEAKFRDVINKGLEVASFVNQEAVRAVEEYFFRRWGLGVSTLIITVLAVSLYAYIRRIES